MSCHGADGALLTSTDNLVVALAGSPNAGKTTLFNALCGMRAKTANYPGVTVSRREGSVRTEAGEVARCVLDQEVYGSAPSDALLDEIGDTLAALSEVCSRHGLSMEAAAERVLAKVEHRAPRWREQLGERLVQLRARWDGPASP